MPCKYWDCGWCYAPDEVAATEIDGQCNNMDGCPQSIPMTTFIFEPADKQPPETKLLNFRDDGDDTEEHW